MVKKISVKLGLDHALALSNEFMKCSGVQNVEFLNDIQDPEMTVFVISYSDATLFDPWYCGVQVGFKVIEAVNSYKFSLNIDVVNPPKG